MSHEGIEDLKPGRIERLPSATGELPARALFLSLSDGAPYTFPSLPQHVAWPPAPSLTIPISTVMCSADPVLYKRAKSLDHACVTFEYWAAWRLRPRGERQRMVALYAAREIHGFESGCKPVRLEVDEPAWIHSSLFRGPTPDASS